MDKATLIDFVFYNPRRQKADAIVDFNSWPKYQGCLRVCHGQSRQSSACPGGLEIESAGDAVDIEALAGEVEPRDDSALHGLEIDLLEINAAAGDEFIRVCGFPEDVVVSVDELLDECGFFVLG